MRNNSPLGRLAFIFHDVLPADALDQFIVFAVTLLLAGMFSKAFASVHLCNTYAVPSAIDQQNIQTLPPSQ